MSAIYTELFNLLFIFISIEIFMYILGKKFNYYPAQEIVIAIQLKDWQTLKFKLPEYLIVCFIGVFLSKAILFCFLHLLLIFFGD